MTNLILMYTPTRTCFGLGFIFAEVYMLLSLCYGASDLFCFQQPPSGALTLQHSIKGVRFLRLLRTVTCSQSFPLLWGGKLNKGRTGGNRGWPVPGLIGELAPTITLKKLDSRFPGNDRNIKVPPHFNPDLV